MAKLEIVKASTDVTICVFIQDSTSTTGAGLTGLAYNSAGLTCYYVRPLAAAAALTLATQTVTGAHSDGGFVEVSSANMPGWYRLDLSDAVCATGVNFVGLQLKGATNMAPVNLEIQLTSVNFNDAVRGGMTALPNANADAAGGLIISDAGGLDADAQRADVAAILVDTGTTLDGRIPAALVGGRMDCNVGAISSDSVAADNAEAFFDGTGYAGTNNVIPTVTTVSAVTTVNGLAAGTITAAAIATGAIDADALAADAVAEIADGVWDEAVAGHAGAGSTGEALSAAGSAGDPWTTALPGAYGAGTAGKIIGDNINATISSRASQTSVDTVDDFLDTEIAALTTELAKVPKSDGTATWNATALASIQTEATDALNAYDPPTNAEMETRTPTAAQLANIVNTGADWINGGRLDLILDDILLDTGTTLPGQIDDIGIKKNTAFSNFEFLMVLTSDHVTPATGLTVTGQRSIDGAAFASVSGTIAEVSNGIYQFDAAAADTNGDVITWRFSAATADDTFVTFKTVA